VIGQRLPDGFDDGLPAAGAYYRDTQGTWTCCTPNALLGNLKAHTVIEFDDGTITVSPSILVTGHDVTWHGYLERGVWRAC
jgi:hypothetical protein